MAIDDRRHAGGGQGLSEMIERVARALCVADGLDPDADWRRSDQSMLAVAIPEGEEQRWRTYASYARAAISALREPTKEMIRAAAQVEKPLLYEKYWKAMIDAALAK